MKSRCENAKTIIENSEVPDGLEMKGKGSTKKPDLSKIYRHFEDTLGVVPEPLRLLGEYAPGILDGYYRMRTWFFREPPEGALPKKIKELIYVALDCALGAPAHFARAHARAAIRAGATKEQVVEAVSLSLMLAGMPKYMSLGHEVIKEAVRAEAEQKRKTSRT